MTQCDALEFPGLYSAPHGAHEGVPEVAPVDAAAADQSLGAALGVYAGLLQTPAAAWVEQLIPRHERGEMRYNAACAFSLARNEAECRAVLERIVSDGDADASELRDEIAADDDFAPLRSCAWMQQLLAQPT